VKELEKERKLNKTRYQRNLVREKRHQLHQQNEDIKLQLFSHDLPYERDSVPNYMFGSEHPNSRSSE
jgi:hypothetical protein